MATKRKRKAPEETTFTAMFEVTAVLGPFVDAVCWDQNDKKMNNIYTNGKFTEPLEVGDVFLWTLNYENGFWKVVFTSGKYETETFSVGEGNEFFDDDCPICQEMKKDLEGVSH